jgi:hypothetical protein
MSLDAELLLLSTGLLEAPTRSHVRAIRGVEAFIVDTLTEAIELENARPQLDVPERKAYHQRLFKLDPKYAENERVLGKDLSAEYQLLHQFARGVMLDRRPVTEMKTLVGPRTVANPPDLDNQYAAEVEAVENYKRLAKDFQAGLVIPPTVALYASLFPETYDLVCTTVRDALIARSSKDEEWYPPPWLENASRVLMRLPFDYSVTVHSPPAPKTTAAPPPDVKPKPLRLRPEAIRTQGQAIGAPSEPRR